MALTPQQGWIGVDFDGTLAHSTTWDCKAGTLPLGEPIPLMVQRVKAWLAEGKEVRIMTARVGQSGIVNDHGTVDNREWAFSQALLIEEWCQKHIGQTLRVTASKDLFMMELWDDRAIQVVRDTGQEMRVFVLESLLDTAKKVVNQ